MLPIIGTRPTNLDRAIFMPVTRGMLLIIYLNIVSQCMLLLAILCPRKFCLDFICGTNIGLGDKTRNVSALSTSPHTLITLSHKTSVWDRKGKSNFIFTIHTRKNLHTGWTKKKWDLKNNGHNSAEIHRKGKKLVCFGKFCINAAG